METAIQAYLEGASIVLLTRENGRRVARQAPAEWVAFFEADEISPPLFRDLRDTPHVRSIQNTEGGWLRVGFVSEPARGDFCTHHKSFVKQLGIRTFEADVSPILRYVVDHNIEIAKPRRVYLDLETDSRVPFSQKNDMRILAWSLVDEDGNSQCGVLDQDTDRCERQLLDQLWYALEPYDQVVAWNGDDFDFPVLFARSMLRGCPVNAARWLWLDHLVLFRRMNLNAAESGDEKQSMKLNDIAQAVVGEGKEVSPPEVIEKFGDKSLGALSWQLWEAGGIYRQILVRYNLKDTILLQRIEKETGYIALFDTLCAACHIFPDSRSINPTLQMDGFMLRLGLERGYHFATKHYRATVEQFKGAWVMEPKGKGILRNVHVCDFASLYPSVILTWNMSPETKCPVPREGEIPENCCRSPLTGIGFRTDQEGILCVALKELLRLRKHWNDIKASCAPGTHEWHEANRKSTAFKTAANSFYGVVGSPFSRFFDPTIAESVTQNGRWLLELTLAAAEKQGMIPIYGDTDSGFVAGVSEESFASFVEWCNKELYPSALQEQGCVDNHIKLAYEKAFERITFVSAKRYIGRYSHFKGKRATSESKPEIKGLEYKRGDAAMLARRMQAQVIDLLCGGLKVVEDVVTPTDDITHYHAVVARWRSHVLEGNLPIEEVKLAQALTKPLKEYASKVKKDGGAASQPAHVRVAKIMQARGEEVGEGTRIEYVVTDGTTSPNTIIPASDYDGTNADRFYLWEDRVYPPTKRLLEAAFPDHNWDEWHKARPPKPRAPRKLKAKALPPVNTA